MNVDELVPYRVLLVEDNRSEAALVGRLLLMSSLPRYDAFTVHALEDALQVLSARAMDLVVLDLGLPDVAAELDGLKRIRAEHPAVPVVVLTGVQAADELRQSAIAAGASECLFKGNLSPEQFHDTLAQALRRAAPVAESH